MTSSETVSPGRDASFSDQDFSRLAELAREKFGLSLSTSKKPLVYSRLSKRLQARQTPSFPQYLDLINRPEEEMERLELISALTTNVTSFFREEHHFDTLSKDCLPDMVSRTLAGGRIRIWSAGCSSGQEPYSIAATVLAGFPDAERHDVRILATDIDPKIVAKAKNATYSIEDVSALPPARTSQMFNLDQVSKTATVKDRIKGMVTCAELNLIDDWPFKGPFDAIFCRNVAIYFDQETQQRLWLRFSNFLRPGGHLFIGHSERVTGAAFNQLKAVGITTYQKIAQHS